MHRAPLLERLIAAGPDAITAAMFVTIWIAPLALGESAVRNAMLMMLVEFVLVHASGFLGAIVLAVDADRRKRILGLLGFSLFYSLFIGAFMLIFQEWWPLLAFGWLLLGKFAGVLGRPRSNDRQARMMASWVFAAVFYLAGIFATVFLPIPRLGMRAELMPQFGLVGEGLWVDEPHRVIAFGAIYFTLTAWMKLRDWAIQSGKTGGVRAG